MENELIPAIMAIYQEGFLKDEEVVSWADKKIMAEAEPFDFYYMLSLKGPKYCLAKPSHEFPLPKSLTYSERFALRASALDMTSKAECENFRRWVASASLGEDLEKPEVIFGYYIDEDFFCTDNHVKGLAYFNKELPQLITQTKHLAEALWAQIA
ncbi:hypothetical protein [Shewanella sp. 10N.286.48.B5]|uniref:hypothetical protein n=1 Tax=Shewanella sp. 10N.286.48.B5 TaxID=1880834 RepID=UPI000C84709B|nr:hypothetical protein [Shewanella sp. 10N.286.48.B5]PMH85771.1 hypothetical protein BCU57_12845 [Shewanella sp. 10N.286.48.B5]